MEQEFFYFSPPPLSTYLYAWISRTDKKRETWKLENKKWSVWNWNEDISSSNVDSFLFSSLVRKFSWSWRVLNQHQREVSRISIILSSYASVWEIVITESIISFRIFYSGACGFHRAILWKTERLWISSRTSAFQCVLSFHIENISRFTERLWITA